MSKTRAEKIKLVLFDVDGVLTDGSIWLLPVSPAVDLPTQAAAAPKADSGGYAIVSQHMVEAKAFHAHDGTAVSLARAAGLKVGLITKRITEAVRLRARDLRLDYVMQGVADKRAALQEILVKEGLRAEEVAFVGDDIIDLPIMRACGLAFAVADARAEVKDAAHVITERAGGRGAARDAIEYILNAQNKLNDAIEAYLGNRVIE